jgi:hypothetical protein
MLAEKWFELFGFGPSGQDKPMAVADRTWRASWSQVRCDRALAYSMAKTPPSNPPSEADAWRFGLGELVHLGLQDAVIQAFPGAEVEKAIDLRSIGIDGAASSDLMLSYEYVEDTPTKIVSEFKTVNGFKFKLATTNFNGPPEGPSYGHIVQGAMAAAASDADELRIVYLSLENISVAIAKRNNLSEIQRFIAEWSYDAPTFRQIAATEVTRVNEIKHWLDQGIEPGGIPRVIDEPDMPRGATVVDPKKGLWQNVVGGKVYEVGTTWHCGYCRFQDICDKDGAR